MPRSAKFRALALLCFACLFGGCAQRPAREAAAVTQSGNYVIENVTVLPMTSDEAVIHDAAVVVENGRITSLHGPTPAGARRIDGTGKWLIPGLFDMHVHVPSAGYLRPKLYVSQPPWPLFDVQQIMTPYIANGVTTIVNLDAQPEAFGQRNEVERGDVFGPHMVLAALIDGGSGSGRVANTPSDGRQSVRDAKAQGYELIKPYSRLTAETFKAIVDEAHQQGLKTVGHIPDAFKGRVEQAFSPNFNMIAHAEELSKQSKGFSDDDAQRFAQLAKANGTWLSPTLTTMERILSQMRSLDELRASPNLQYVHPLIQSRWLEANNYNRRATPERIVYYERVLEFHVRLVKAFKAAGVPLVAGTDTLTSGLIAGFSLHDELESLVRAGLTNAEALSAATRLPAIWLGVDVDRGTIEVGKRADLVLLDADPFQDVANTRRIAGVALNDRWADRLTLERMLSELAEWNTAHKSQYDWNNARQ